MIAADPLEAKRRALLSSFAVDPLAFVRFFWPDVKLYDKQVEVLLSVRDNDETYVPAGNGLGKDYIGGLVALWFYCTRSPARVVTTSVKYEQLKSVLWGEIRSFVESSAQPLPIQMNDLHIRQILNGKIIPKGELVGITSDRQEATLGRHVARGQDGLPRTLILFDEASGVSDAVYDSSDTWAHRKLIIGNCWPCANFFFRGVQGGDVFSRDGKRCYKKVIRITAEDSPNVRLARARIARNKEPNGKILIPGVIDWDTLQAREQLWDEIKKCVGLHARFHTGADVMLVPSQWLALCRGAKPATQARAMGVDTGEGGDPSAWVIVGERGILKIRSQRTPDTSVIPGITLALMKQYGLAAERVYFDLGGGGHEHVDHLRSRGFAVRGIGFGESAKPHVIVNHTKGIAQREQERAQVYTFKNRRAEMYFGIRQALRPDENERPRFHIPTGAGELTESGVNPYEELIRQLAAMPLLYDEEGRIYLPPKDRPRGSTDKKPTLREILGRSPDEADALALAIFGMNSRSAVPEARAL